MPRYPGLDDSRWGICSYRMPTDKPGTIKRRAAITSIDSYNTIRSEHRKNLSVVGTERDGNRSHIFIYDFIQHLTRHRYLTRQLVLVQGCPIDMVLTVNANIH